MGVTSIRAIGRGPCYPPKGPGGAQTPRGSDAPGDLSEAGLQPSRELCQGKTQGCQDPKAGGLRLLCGETQICSLTGASRPEAFAWVSSFWTSVAIDMTCS